MKFTKVRPTKVGTQFVAVWEYNNKIWCDTYSIGNDGMEVHNQDTDIFYPIDEDWLGWPDRPLSVKFAIIN